MTETSGKKLLELSKSPNQLFLLEKMLVGLLNSISTPYSRTWRVKTTPQGALIFQLRASVQNTKEKEYGLFPTPTQDSASERTKKYKQGGMPLPMAVKMFPTPTTSEHKYRLKGNTQASNCLEARAKKTGGKLSANFTEYLMGFPMDWTKIEPKELKLSEMQ